MIFRTAAILTAMVGLVQPEVAAAQQSGWPECRDARSAQDRIVTCSRAIGVVRDKRLLERIYLRRGNANSELGQWQSAVADFTELVRMNPSVAGYYDNRLNAYRQLGQFQSALNDGNAAVRLAPDRSFPYRSRGLVLEDLGRIDLAISDFSTAIRIEPRDAGLRVDRGRLRVQVSQFAEAMADFNEALSVDPRMFSALRERGKLHIILGNREAALADLRLFVQVEPSDQEGIAALASAEGTPRQPNQPPTAASSPVRPPVAEPRASSGTGFFVAQSGLVVTNAHVVDGCSTLTAKISGGQSSSATVLSLDKSNDLALLRTGLTPRNVATIRSGVRLGEQVAAFGFPLAGLLSTSGNFTLGHVSALTGLGDNAGLLQISTPVQPGNSGGPLVDQSGNVVGVIVGKLDAVKVAAVTKDLAQNVNFAIKASILVNFLESSGSYTSSVTANATISSADLAEKAKSISVFIECR